MTPHSTAELQIRIWIRSDPVFLGPPDQDADPESYVHKETHCKLIFLVK